MVPAFDSEVGVYRGRFAPSPSGPLHFGSLIAALGSYLDAKAHQGKWLLRIEDIDSPRVVPGASDSILRTLDAFALHWDETVVYQSQRHELYQHTLIQLHQQHAIYACQCTRKQIKASGGVYSNQCRDLSLDLKTNALRLKQQHPVTDFIDRIQGPIHVSSDFANEDFIVKRRDGLFAYQLVVVLDDIDQGITDIVRGADLLEPTVRQISLYQLLNQPVPQFAHLPLAVTEPGFKLSKQNHAPAVDNQNPSPALVAALAFLGLQLPKELHSSSPETILSWAIAHWHIDDIPKQTEILLACQ
ncbi:glutamyl-Q tRNA(Asp) synthetase [Pseudoalteromonas ulvae UL12]|uniref:Glutamyl-Q tRNA(Asp) synthetase n=1 Tax=Pseudoalteromonas ulvae TaxID=107327 RepID=A0A244CQL0_PSEDV|nr:tRNA glutamyl-Q(34) synthetase GluQRS [Pseudoalteromonas ulvae]MBE0365236.1 glutamyl-Q tRNA(Asp) synthetase [Pseudoalteromonas ulvae UL12]OUL57776.1 tRNA glutamyl-Q(34) synthetase GluQRS [Pseudoalteromonas ulvae]